MRPIPITHFLRSAAMKGFFSPAFLSALCLLASSLTCHKHNPNKPRSPRKDAPPTLAATGTGASQAVLSLPRSASRPCPHEPVLVCSLCPGSFPKLPQHLTTHSETHKTQDHDNRPLSTACSRFSLSWSRSRKSLASFSNPLAPAGLPTKALSRSAS